MTINVQTGKHNNINTQETPAKSDNTQVTDLSSDTDPFYCFSKDLVRNEEVLRSQLTIFVRKDLFPMWKFFTHEKQLEYTDERRSVCQWVCNKLNVPSDQRRDWWREKSKTISSMLNRKRSDVQGSMKNIFMSK